MGESSPRPPASDFRGLLAAELAALAAELAALGEQLAAEHERDVGALQREVGQLRADLRTAQLAAVRAELQAAKAELGASQRLQAAAPCVKVGEAAPLRPELGKSPGGAESAEVGAVREPEVAGRPADGHAGDSPSSRKLACFRNGCTAGARAVVEAAQSVPPQTLVFNLGPEVYQMDSADEDWDRQASDESRLIAPGAELLGKQRGPADVHRSPAKHGLARVRPADESWAGPPSPAPSSSFRSILAAELLAAEMASMDERHAAEQEWDVAELERGVDRLQTDVRGAQVATLKAELQAMRAKVWAARPELGERRTEASAASEPDSADELHLGDFPEEGELLQEPGVAAEPVEERGSSW